MFGKVERRRFVGGGGTVLGTAHVLEKAAHESIINTRETGWTYINGALTKEHSVNFMYNNNGNNQMGLRVPALESNSDAGGVFTRRQTG